MHGSAAMVESLVSALSAQRQGEQQVDMLLCPPAVYIPSVVRQIADSAILVGGQNCSQYEQGAYTGEVAAEMLAEIGCGYVLVGHSERRAIYGESSTEVAEKFAAALRAGLVPILCVGETLEQRESGDTEAVVAGQIQAVIDRSGLTALCDAIIAYEPVWAIGTGKTATPQQAQQVHAAIRGQLGSAGSKTRILYGGSVKAENAKELFSQPDIDGGLVGGASLDAQEFVNIAKAAEAE